MRIFLFTAAASALAAPALADSQSSNTSSNSSSNNGVVRERIVDTYCSDGWCDRSVSRHIYRDDRKSRRAQGWRWHPDGYWVRARDSDWRDDD